MSDNLYQFQIIIHQAEAALLVGTWSTDKDATIEVMDSINHHRPDIRAQVHLNIAGEEFSVWIRKNGHLLFQSEPVTDDDRLRETLRLINLRDKSLWASVTTKGVGRVTLSAPTLIGG